MDPRQQQKEALFEAARHLTSPAERAAYLDRACARDPELRHEVEAMLRDDAAAEAYFQTSSLPAELWPGNPGFPPGTSSGGAASDRTLAGAGWPAYIAAHI